MHQVNDAANNFIRAIKEASEKDLEAAYQALASRANDSELGQLVEPLQGSCVSIQAEFRRRAL